MASLRSLEQTFHEAFNGAQEARKAKGLKPLSAEIRKGRDGSQRVGLSKYRITYWAQPWHYADLLRLQQSLRLPSIYKTLEHIIEHALPAQKLAARPQPRRTDATGTIAAHRNQPYGKLRKRRPAAPNPPAIRAVAL